jgi:hypothetical protein
LVEGRTGLLEEPEDKHLSCREQVGLRGDFLESLVEVTKLQEAERRLKFGRHGQRGLVSTSKGEKEGGRREEGGGRREEGGVWRESKRYL